MITNKPLKTIIIYIVQVGSLWGLLEGYTYFKDDALKEFIGPYWILIYILPFISTAFIILRESRMKGHMQENISTQGDFSPGKIKGDYSISTNAESSNKLSKLRDKDEVIKNEKSNIEADKIIKTNGNYSPGEVGGDYKIEK